MRRTVADDNGTATERRAQSGNCNPDFVWRLANPEDHVCVTPQVRDQTQVDNRLASSRLAAAARVAPLTPSVRMRVPFPPQTPGCHQLVNGVWQDEPCVSDEYIRTHPRKPPLPGPSIQSNPKAFFFFPPFNFQLPADKIIWGSVAFNITSDPTQITEVDSQAGANAFSVQVNTNTFTCSTCSSGYRLIVSRDGRVVRLFTRRDHDWTDGYPAIAAGAAKLRAKSFTLDGEAVVVGADGVAVFEALHRRHKASDAILYAFDILELDGEDLRPMPLGARKAKLARLLARKPAGIVFNEHAGR
jgi:hypothetical protein